MVVIRAVSLLLLLQSLRNHDSVFVLGGAVQTSKLQIMIPKELLKPGDGYDHRDALFGIPPYGGSIQQQVFYADSTLCGPDINTTGGYPERDGKPWQTPYILLVDRGDCSFVQKVRNAQRAGASGVLIADDSCLCDHKDCPLDDGEMCESQEPLMADDGSGADVSIPSFLVFKEDAIKIIKVLKENHRVRAQMSFKVPAPDNRVEYDLWTSASDPVSRPIEQSWEVAAQALKEHARFTPHLYIYDGQRAGCQVEGENQCYTLCTNKGLYCSTDPDGDLEAGASGADVVIEALRRICIWKKYGETDGIGKQWWAYVQDFIAKCDSPDAGETTRFNDPACVEAAMKQAGVDADAIAECMRSSGDVSENASGTNSLLAKEISDQQGSGVVLIPSLVVNGAVVRGSLSFSTVLKAVCAGFSTGSEPDVCRKCANCHDEFQCVHNGTCPVNTVSNTTTNITSGVPTHIFAIGMIALVVLFATVMVFQYHRQQAAMRDQVRGIVQEYMPVTAQNTRFGGDTSVGIPQDDEEDNNGIGEGSSPRNGSFSIS